MCKIMMVSWGGTEREFLSGLTYEEALQICEDNNWVMDTGYIWDLVIEEED